jgi:hypothetical protein
VRPERLDDPGQPSFVELPPGARHDGDDEATIDLGHPLPGPQRFVIGAGPCSGGSPPSNMTIGSLLACGDDFSRKLTGRKA